MDKSRSPMSAVDIPHKSHTYIYHNRIRLLTSQVKHGAFFSGFGCLTSGRSLSSRPPSLRAPMLATSKLCCMTNSSKMPFFLQCWHVASAKQLVAAMVITTTTVALFLTTLGPRVTPVLTLALGSTLGDLVYSSVRTPQSFGVLICQLKALY